MLRLLSAAAVFMLTAVSALAHSTFQNPMWVEYGEKEITVKMHVSAKEICTTAGIPIASDGTVEKELVIDSAEAHVPYLLEHFTVTADGTKLAGKVTHISPPKTWDEAFDGIDRSHFIFDLTFPVASPPARISLWQNMMSEFSYSSGTPFNFSYMVRFGPAGQVATDFGPLPANGTFDFATGMVPEPSTATAPQPVQHGSWTRFKNFLTHGIHHVLGGYDHLLFASALVLALRSFWEVFKIIGIFTLAHSITVTLSAYQLVKLPSWFPVEVLISASIVFVALENILFPASTHGWRRVIITFCFGLVHGLGLAGAFVANLEGFSIGAIAGAVVAFCAGVEIGHLIIVAPLSLAMTNGRRFIGEHFNRRALRWGSVAIAIAGSYYLLSHLGVVPENLTPDKVFGAE